MARRLGDPRSATATWIKGSIYSLTPSMMKMEVFVGKRVKELSGEDEKRP